MTSFISRRPVLTTTTALTVFATGYYLSNRNPLRMDSAQTPLAHTLSMPKNMLFSKQLKVTDVQQVNHDTKRIIFELPGGKNEVSGVTPGGMQSFPWHS